VYRARHFSIEELVPELAYRERGEAAWELLDEQMLISADQCRDHFGPMFINTWHLPHLHDIYGYRQYSGFRTLGFFQEVFGDERGMQKYLASYSQHKFGRAFDAVFRDCSAGEARDYIRRHPYRFPYITAIEREVPWLHADVRNTRSLMEFGP